LGHRIGVEITENEESMTPARKQTRFIGYPTKNIAPILTALPRLIGQF